MRAIYLAKINMKLPFILFYLHIVKLSATNSQKSIFCGYVNIFRWNHWICIKTLKTA